LHLSLAAFAAVIAFLKSILGAGLQAWPVAGIAGRKTVKRSLGLYGPVEQ
jgi:hypothetical protein